MPDDDWMLSSGTVEFREEERRHRADDLSERDDFDPDYGPDEDDGCPEEDDR